MLIHENAAVTPFREGLLARPPSKLPPSQDPERQEVVIISGTRLAKHTHEVVVYRIQRKSDRTFIELAGISEIQDKQPTVASPLLDAFVAGYVAAEVKQRKA